MPLFAFELKGDMHVVIVVVVVVAVATEDDVVIDAELINSDGI